ncbi:MAG TPA: nucleotidyl transferase AbiEii/AbiGii toxin family protein [Verrucomicrobiae bacterium]|nr:nucleotidyl transferase AbiEii/AbiGii toxin family protein [Verrucomicrobiae bacterium]
MPLTTFQKEILAVLAANRSEESHFAGGIVLNAADDSPRFSHDFDIFHEIAEEVARSSDRDVAALRAAGFQVTIASPRGEWEQDAAFRKARVSRGNDLVEIDWAADSAFRFFPIERDPVLGWRLHLFDVATNKALALSARTETRDYVDIVELNKSFPLAAICWAACGKDPGFTPLSLLEMMKRFARINPTDLDKIKARALDPVKLKMAWIEMSDAAEADMIRVADEQPDLPIGVAFVDVSGRPGWIGNDPKLRVHAPSVRGCWPTMHGVE